MKKEKKQTHKKIVYDLYEKYFKENELNAVDKILLLSRFLSVFSNNFPVEIYERERIVGTNWHWRWQSPIKDKIKPVNEGHFIPDFQDFLKKGIIGKKEIVNKIIPKNDIERTNKVAFSTALCAFSEYIKKYADKARELYLTVAESSEKVRLLQIANDCEYISKHSPTTFCQGQALQLVWFIQSYLDTESGRAAISLGRIDQYLYPYYAKDIKDGAITLEEAKELIACFYIKVSEGNESCMLTVGGDDENELSSLFIEAQTLINMQQPSIAVRVAKSTSESLLEKSKDLALLGGGMPAYFNDDIVVKGLQNIGVDRRTALNYGVVGCYEIAPQGHFADTVAYGFGLYDSLEQFLEKEQAYASFEQFLNAYKAYFEEVYRTTHLPAIKQRVTTIKEECSPFADCVLRGGYEKGLSFVQGGEGYFLVGLNILEIGVLVDSLYTIKKFVFDEGYTTINYLNQQAKKDFQDKQLYAKIKRSSTYYGANDAESNQLAKNVSEFIADVIAHYPLERGIILSPALFWFAVDIHQREQTGMINGRKKGELLSYGIMPCATPHRLSISSALLSSANIATHRFPNGCPAMVSINRKDIERSNVLNALLKAYFEAGGFHLAVNIVDSVMLKEAKKRPSEYSDIIVKISGFSTQFVGLEESIQDAVIERAEKGI